MKQEINVELLLDVENVVNIFENYISPRTKKTYVDNTNFFFFSAIGRYCGYCGFPEVHGMYASLSGDHSNNAHFYQQINDLTEYQKKAKRDI